MNEFDTDRRFDRVVSIEMFEHMKNYRELMRRIAGWLSPEGKLFVHIFAHRTYAYPYETTSEDDWMGRHFFTGGNMPSDRPPSPLPGRSPDRGRLAGLRTPLPADGGSVAPKRLDAHRARVLSLFEGTYGKDDALMWVARWRTFFMSCAELWGYRGGDEWLVAHYLFTRRGSER